MLGACVSAPKRQPLPTDLNAEAHVPGVPDARTWGDEIPYYAEAWFAQSREEVQQRYPAWFSKQHYYLAISGGGTKGAFGAGLLVGTTASGKRPEFQLVTGISTGALTAPFAFLGPDYDPILREIYTTYSTGHLLKKRNLINAFTSDAMFSTKRLENLIVRCIDQDLMEALAAEHRKGRALNIGTTNLDVERPVIWRITQIAASDYPKRLELIRKIILASASIPAAFPPVAIEVEANGKHYDELHVDGGAASQVFLYPAAIVDRKLLPIAGRSVSSLIRTQGVGDLYRIFAVAERDGLDFNLAFIPATFTDLPKEEFDPVWMRKLFDVGYELGRSGYPRGEGTSNVRRSLERSLNWRCYTAIDVHDSHTITA